MTYGKIDKKAWYTHDTGNSLPDINNMLVYYVAKPEGKRPGEISLSFRINSQTHARVMIALHPFLADVINRHPGKHGTWKIIGATETSVASTLRHLPVSVDSEMIYAPGY